MRRIHLWACTLGFSLVFLVSAAAESAPRGLASARLVQRATVARGDTFVLKTPSKVCITRGVIQA